MADWLAVFLSLIGAVKSFELHTKDVKEGFAEAGEFY